MTHVTHSNISAKSASARTSNTKPMFLLLDRMVHVLRSTNTVGPTYRDSSTSTFNVGLVLDRVAMRVVTVGHAMPLLGLVTMTLWKLTYNTQTDNNIIAPMNMALRKFYLYWCTGHELVNVHKQFMKVCLFLCFCFISCVTCTISHALFAFDEQQ